MKKIFKFLFLCFFLQKNNSVLKGLNSGTDYLRINTHICCTFVSLKKFFFSDNRVHFSVILISFRTRSRSIFNTFFDTHEFNQTLFIIRKFVIAFRLILNLQKFELTFTYQYFVILRINVHFVVCHFTVA